MSQASLGVWEAARQQAGCSVVELWIAYFAIGGLGSVSDIQAILAGRAQPERREHERLAQALNDRFVGMAMDHPVPYFDEMAR